MNNKLKFLFQPKTHWFLYILLLILTPFLLLQNYLQSFIGQMSVQAFEVFNINFPYTVAIALIIVIALIIFLWKKFTSIRLIGWGVILLLFWIGQKSTDYYFNHDFYELQYNWHYFAYGIFAYLNYRRLSVKKVSPQKLILNIYIYAICISTFDEAIQIPLSNRIFDLGDIAKDLWGTIIGLVFIFFILENGKILKNGWKIRQKKTKDYIQNPLSLFLLEIVFAYILMFISSILTDTKYLFPAIFISILIFLLFFFIFHLSQKKLYRYIFLTLFISLIGVQGIYFFKYKNQNIIYNNNRLLIYKGIPIYYFDLLIHPDGMFRLVDKKETFNKRDLQKFMNLSENILIIGSGENNTGGRGFPKDTESQFIYNNITNSGLQIIKLENKEACKKFNQLRDEGKKPTLILHND
ncbi:MAG: VanZ family protein [Bacteroidales bacterium]|nr:VanZ family protein [Bacteroidales bacterium]